MKQFQTIREVAKSGIIAENCLRVFVKEGKIPGFYSGNRFYVDMKEFRDALRKLYVCKESYKW